MSNKAKTNKPRNQSKKNSEKPPLKNSNTDPTKSNTVVSQGTVEAKDEFNLKECLDYLKCFKAFSMLPATKLSEFEELVKKHQSSSNNNNDSEKTNLIELKNKFESLIHFAKKPQAPKDKNSAEKPAKKEKQPQRVPKDNKTLVDLTEAVSQERLLKSLIKNANIETIQDEGVVAVVEFLQSEERRDSSSLVSHFLKLPNPIETRSTNEDALLSPSVNDSLKQVELKEDSGHDSEPPVFDDSDFEKIELRTHVVCPKGGIAFYGKSLLNEEEAVVITRAEPIQSQNITSEAPQVNVEAQASIPSIPQAKSAVVPVTNPPAKLSGLPSRPIGSQQPPYTAGPPPISHFNQMAPHQMPHGPMPPHLPPNASQPPFPNMQQPASFPPFHPANPYNQQPGPNIPNQGIAPNQGYNGMPHAPPEHMMNLYQQPYPPYNNFNPNTYPQHPYPPNFQNQGPPPAMYPPHLGAPFNHGPYPGHHTFPPQGMQGHPGPQAPHHGLPPHSLANISQRPPVKVIITNPNKGN